MRQRRRKRNKERLEDAYGMNDQEERKGNELESSRHE